MFIYLVTRTVFPSVLFLYSMFINVDSEEMTWASSSIFPRTNRVRRGTDSNIDDDDTSLVSHNIESTLGDLNNAVARRPSWRRKISQRLKSDATQKGGGGGGVMTLRRYRSSLKRWSLSRASAAAADGHDERQRLPTVKVTGASGDRDAESEGNPVAVGDGERESSSDGGGTRRVTEREDARPSEGETAFAGGNDRNKNGSAGAADPAEVEGTAAESNGDARASAADPALLMVSTSRDPSASFRLRRRRVQVRDKARIARLAVYSDRQKSGS